MTDISVRRSDQQITGKKYARSDNQPSTENTWGEEDVHISSWDLKRKYKVCNFGLKAETHWPLKRRGRLPRVCSPAVALLHKKGPHHRRKMCANFLWLYSYFKQTSPSKNKNINYIFIDLRVFRCLSSGSICDPMFNPSDYYKNCLQRPAVTWMLDSPLCLIE